MTLWHGPPELREMLETMRVNLSVQPMGWARNACEALDRILDGESCLGCADGESEWISCPSCNGTGRVNALRRTEET